MSEGQTTAIPATLKSVQRTRRYFALQLEDTVQFLLASDLSQIVTLKEAKRVETSILDDVALVAPFNEQSNPKFFNIENGAQEAL